jgi:hypothetical protein
MVDQGPDGCMQSFDNLEHWRTDFINNASPSDPDSFPFLVLGNKCDLEAERKVCEGAPSHWPASTVCSLPVIYTCVCVATFPLPLQVPKQKALQWCKSKGPKVRGPAGEG